MAAILGAGQRETALEWGDGAAHAEDDEREPEDEEEDGGDEEEEDAEGGSGAGKENVLRDGRVACVFCGKAGSRKHRAAHERACKKNPNRLKPQKQFKCTFAGCGRGFSREDNLRAHQRLHGKQETECGKKGCKFVTTCAETMQHHRNGHELEDVYETLRSREHELRQVKEANAQLAELARRDAERIEYLEAQVVKLLEHQSRQRVEELGSALAAATSQVAFLRAELERQRA